MDALTQRIKLHEGLNQSAYPDSLGYLTIGWGKLIDSRLGGKLSIAACDFILAECIAESRAELAGKSYYKYLDSVRADAIVELCFAMGIEKLEKFVNMLDALKVKDYIRAANELRCSLWASEVGPNRACDVAHRLEFGRYI
jgi:lysozyme